MPESDITPDTHLAKDLFADQMDISEIINRALEDNFREAKQIPGDRMTVSEIVAFVDQADYQVFAMVYRGDSDNGETGAETPQELGEDVYFQKIFFASNRQPTGKKLPDPVFSGTRSGSGQVSYGTCLISIPKKHVRGKLEQPMNFGFYRREPIPSEHFMLRSMETLTWNDFLAGITNDLKPFSENDVTAQDIMIFVHGFNVPFTRAALRTGQVAFDLQFQGAPILFSWPSRGGILSYISDREAVEWSVVYIEKFLTDIIENTNARKYHLIAHSMGNQGVIPALYQMALRGKFKDKAVFGNIILAAPDFDARKFAEQVAPEVKPLAERWTIYASAKDAALKASKLLRLDTSQRLGQPLVVVEGMDTVDASDFEVTPWNLSENHSYFSTKLKIIKDVRAVLRGMAPTTRELMRKLREKQVYWEISQD